MRAQAERNMQNEVGQIINRSIMIKFVSAVISAIKIAISSVFLSKYSASCNNNDFTYWIVLMMMHDLINILYVAFYMIFSRFFVNQTALFNEYENQIRAQYQPLHDEDHNGQLNPNNPDAHQDLVESQCKILLVIKEINKM